jgi:mono/diheme cytochrome c family protein
MPQFVDQTIGRFTARRGNRGTMVLITSCGLLAIILSGAACAGVSDNGTTFETLATMEARRTAPPPTEGSPVPGGETDDPAALAAAGQQIWSTMGCQGCHTTDGSAAAGPSWSGLWMSEVELADGSTVTADEGYIRRAILEPNAQVHAGFPAIMPSFQGQLDDNQIQAVIEFIKTLE